MLNIIKSDCYRILQGKAIYICLLVLLFLNVVSAIGMNAGSIGLTSSFQATNKMEDTEFMEKVMKAKTLHDVREIMKSGGEFELDKDVVGQNINLYYFFIVIVVIVLCTDFSNKSIKNTLSSAISRKKYYFSKVLLIFGLSTIIILFGNFSFYIMNLVINGKNFSSPLKDMIKLTWIQMPLLYGIISLLIFFAFAVRKTSTFNTISIPFIMVFQLIAMGVIHLFKLKATWFYNYEMQFALAKLVESPTNEYLLKCMILGVFYIVVFNVIGFYLFQKSEIK